MNPLALPARPYPYHSIRMMIDDAKWSADKIKNSAAQSGKQGWTESNNKIISINQELSFQFHIHPYDIHM